MCSSIYICSAFRNASACRRDRDFTTSRLPSQTAESLVKYARQNRCYCQTCRVLFAYPDGQHEHHRVISGLSSSALATPTYLLEPLEESSEHAVCSSSCIILHFLHFDNCLLFELVKSDNGIPRFCYEVHIFPKTHSIQKKVCKISRVAQNSLPICSTLVRVHIGRLMYSRNKNLRTRTLSKNSLTN